MRGAESWKRAKEVFDIAVAHGLDDRAAFVRDRCAGDDALVADVESLLEADAACGPVFELPVAPALRAEVLEAVADVLSDGDHVPMMPGSQFGQYEVTEFLGAGSMGEVYRARDTKLGRDVAIKVLPAQWTVDSEHRLRFEREARLLAALNHPNIGAIYGIEDSAGVRGLVLELVEGHTLAERIGAKRTRTTSARGLRLTDALSLAQQIATALEVAHESGIVHRDLKPANIKITPAGTAKILDFGVARAAVETDEPSDVPRFDAVTNIGTRDGAVIGTAPYMSPEQARGEDVDRRTDVWAFGCVLYEMLTGARAFEGSDTTATMSQIFEREPDLAALPAQTPTSVRRLLGRCLEKDRHKRLAQIAVARFQLEDAIASLASVGRAAVRSRRRLHTMLALGVMAGVLAGMAIAWFAVSGPASNPSDVTRSLLSVTPAERMGGTEGRPTRTAVALSRDGRALVFSAVQGGTRALYVRALNQAQAVKLAGTDGADTPFLSPDGQWVGYWASGELRKVPVSGGTPVRVAQASPLFGASWGDDDRIVYSRAEGALLEVPAAGGTPSPLTVVNGERGEVSHRHAHVLPGGDAVLYTITKERFPRWDETQIAVYSRRAGTSKILVEGGADARFASTGYLVYVKEGALFAAPFDEEKLELAGGAVGVAADVMQAAYFRIQGDDTGAAQFSISATGTLVYVPGGITPSAGRSVVWVDRTGRSEPLPLEPRPFVTLRLSPDAQRIALSTFGRDRDIWVYAHERRTLSKLSVPGRIGVPVWTPDGERLTYAASTGGPDTLHWVRADSVGAPEPLVEGQGNLVPGTWTPDGRQLLYYPVASNLSRATWVYDMATKGPSTTLMRSAGSTVAGGVDISRDGRWIAYQSNESGDFQVYVQAYPTGVPRLQISDDGGISPVWRGDGKELFYVKPNADWNRSAGNVDIMAVSIEAQAGLSVGTPKALFSGEYAMNAPARGWDVTPDGQRFLLIRADEQSPAGNGLINIVQNWHEELKRLVPRPERPARK
jgi:eukaryotic-like serine/threonine-protein kinase